MRMVVVAMVLVVAGSACTHRPHVTLSAPPPTAPVVERLQAYGMLRPVDGRIIETRNCSSRGGCTSDIRGTLTLANGVIVHHAEDLAPVVRNDSRSAQAIQRVHARRARASMWGTVALAGLGGLVAGGVLNQLGANAEVSVTVSIAGLGALLVGSFARHWNRRQAAFAEIEAFEHFDASLAQRLDLCVNGLVLVPCTGAPAGLWPATAAPEVHSGASHETIGRVRGIPSG